MINIGSESLRVPTGQRPRGSEGLLWMFDGRPKTYVDFASEYFEKAVEVDLVRRMYGHETLSREIVAQLNAEAVWEDVLTDAAEIRYPVQS